MVRGGSRSPGFSSGSGRRLPPPCLGQGVRLVWGPPGTGKTTVLSRAICDLTGQGDRVLLVSATNIAVDNIAVDNALLGVVKQRRHTTGQIVRVGPPQLKATADDPDACLPKTEVLDAATASEAAALRSAGRHRQLEDALALLEAQRGVARWRAKDRREQLQAELRTAEQRARQDAADAARARVVADARGEALDRHLSALIAHIPYTRDQSDTHQAGFRQAWSAHQLADQQVREVRRKADLRQRQARRAKEAQTLTADAEQRGWPARHATIERLRPQAAEDSRGDLNAELFAHPPHCGQCGGTSIEIRRRKNDTWFWRCYDGVCKADPRAETGATRGHRT
ncbi:AAA domain-containing protein [Frankia sp. AgB32]|uniref:AAA domain-containing protein n=1 Tax=Frankia sp. AgB32 TaxID=631119 RepID=UPI00200FD7D2|nr:AAA domain-containing protein [Frankia sp. AgB32]MCK9894438.1 AAA family ATPase [Frankia sp. AgB32]